MYDIFEKGALIDCNVSKKGAFSALKMITADEMPSIVKKAPFSLKISYFSRRIENFRCFYQNTKRFLFKTHVNVKFPRTGLYPEGVKNMIAPDVDIVLT